MSKADRKSALRSGRPPLTGKAKKVLPSKVTRTIIRRHHTLHKQLAQALKTGATTEAENIEREIENQGGLKVYQDASITGQSADRGGDSSKVLMQWLPSQDSTKQIPRLRMLEVGALSTTNACAKSGWFDMTWIDLNSQEPKIEKQDFMKRPLPVSNADRFDMISLSLVVNYVPDATQRGEMLRRTRDFLVPGGRNGFGLLFLVVPASCVTNSRYMTEDRLNSIMTSLGYSLAQRKLSPKLYYSLWQLNPEYRGAPRSFPKLEVNPGKTRNNFCIILT